MEYSGVKLHNSITVGKIFSIHYFEYMNNFKFSGEAHNFWEFVYIDKGEAGITHNKSYTVLHKGELFFHKPNEFHSVRATGTIAPNLIVISFECNDKAMNFFNNRRMKIDETAQTLLANIIIEAKRCFNCRLDDPYLPLSSKYAFKRHRHFWFTTNDSIIFGTFFDSFNPMLLSIFPATQKAFRSKASESYKNK